MLDLEYSEKLEKVATSMKGFAMSLLRPIDLRCDFAGRQQYCSLGCAQEEGSRRRNRIGHGFHERLLRCKKENGRTAISLPGTSRPEGAIGHGNGSSSSVCFR